MTQTYYMKDADGEYFVAQPQPTLRETEPEELDGTMPVAERVVRIVLAKAKGICLSKVHAIDNAGNSYLREASATQCANAIGSLNIQPLIDQVHKILSLPTPAEPPADVAWDAERYRWLRDKCRATGEHWGGRWSLVIEGPCPDGDKSSGAIDKAIDAARERQGGES